MIGRETNQEANAEKCEENNEELKECSATIKRKKWTELGSIDEVKLIRFSFWEGRVYQFLPGSRSKLWHIA